ncbi:MFS transporter [Kitasatospora aburaviensis]
MSAASTVITPRLRQGRAALAAGFLLQGTTFALLVTCIPELQDRYGLSDSLLPVFLAAVPILAGVGSITSEQLVRRTGARAVLRVVQPAVCLTLAGVGFGDELWQLALALGAFGLLVGALDASMNMLGVGLQHRYGRSIMIGFHAAFSLGAILGAALAGLGSHYDAGLPVLFGAAAAVIALLAVLAGALPGLRPGDPPQPSAGGPQRRARRTRRRRPGGRRGRRPVDPLAPAAAALPGDGLRVHRGRLRLQLQRQVPHRRPAQPRGRRQALLPRLHGGDAARPGGRRPRGAALGRRPGGAGRGRAGRAGLRGGRRRAGAWAGIAGFTVLGLGICAIIPQVFAAGGRLFPADSDAAVARLNLFNYAGFLVGSPLVGAVADASSYRWALLAPMLLVLAVLPLAGRFAPAPAPVPAPAVA